MDEQPFDNARSEAFAGVMVDILNHASLALMMSIGHKVGLFDAMASMAPGSTDVLECAQGAGSGNELAEFEATMQHQQRGIEHIGSNAPCSFSGCGRNEPMRGKGIAVAIQDVLVARWARGVFGFAHGIRCG